MADLISVIIPTYNPDASRLDKTIQGLKHQIIALTNWELIIVDNNSIPSVNINLDWHPHHKIVRETRAGLTYARLKGFEQAKGNIIVMVDDDNILDKSYLQNTLNIFNSNKKLAAIGGKSIPLFESTPPVWLPNFYSNLALRDLGEEVLTTHWQNQYPSCAPIGAGMCLKTEALKTYVDKLQQGGSLITDRTGDMLFSGGDNDIVLETLKSGWQVGYFPKLKLQHVIPAERMQVNYLGKLLNHSNKSWIQLLDSHQINPWEKIPGWTVPFRKAKAWVTNGAWKNETNYIKWQAACGMFEGLAAI